MLKQLIDTGHIVQVQGPRDRRQRELYPTAKGRALALDAGAATVAPHPRGIGGVGAGRTRKRSSAS